MDDAMIKVTFVPCDYCIIATCFNLPLNTYLAMLLLDTSALKARIMELEAKHLGVKNQIFEMECRLLKCISDNKQYIVQKMRLSQIRKLSSVS